METVTDFSFLGSKITEDGDCSHEIKRHLLLGRRAMTNLDSILKSRDITLLTKAHLVKAMVFPVVMYGCENWAIKKAECQRTDAFELWCWRRLLRVPWTARRSNQSILKEISPEYSLEGPMLKLKLQYFDHLCREPTHETLPKTRPWGRKPDGQGGSGFQGFQKAAPGAHLKDDICLSDVCLNGLFPNFCDTGRRPSPNQFRTLINKFPRWWYFMRLSRVKRVF